MKKIIIISLLLLTNINYSQCMESFWTEGYQKAISGFWGKIESVSGPGSSLDQTETIRTKIQKIINDLKISTIFDAPCGDFNWMRFVDLENCKYIGADVVEPLINQNNLRYSNKKRTFLHIDVTKDILPKCELIICRDLLVHFSSEDVFKALNNFKKSGAKYLLVTTFVSHRSTINQEIETGGWRPINLEIYPFNFPAPELIINENCTEQNGQYNDKSLALWKLENIILPGHRQ